MKKRIKFLNLIGLALLVIIIIKIDLGEILNYLKRAKYEYLIMAYPFIMINIFLKSIRWNYLMKTQRVITPVTENFYVYLWAFYFGAVTPGRIGEVSKAIYYKDKFDNMGSAFVSVFMDRLYDLAIRGALLVILYPFYSNLFYFNYLGFILLGVIIIVTLFLFFKMKSIKDIIRKISSFMIPKKYYSIVKDNISGFLDDAVRMVTKPKHVAISILLTVPSFFAYGLVAFLIQKSFGIEMSFFYNIFCLVVSAFSVMVPISVSGLRVSEAVMILLFNAIGIDKEAAVLFSLSIFSLSPFLGFHGWLINIFMFLTNRNKLDIDEN